MTVVAPVSGNVGSSFWDLQGHHCRFGFKVSVKTEHGVPGKPQQQKLGSWLQTFKSRKRNIPFKQIKQFFQSVNLRKRSQHQRSAQSHVLVPYCYTLLTDSDSSTICNIISKVTSHTHSSKSSTGTPPLTPGSQSQWWSIWPG